MKYYPNLSLKYDFEITTVGGENVAVCVGEGVNAFHGVIKLGNPSAVFMFRKLKEGTTFPQLIMDCLNEFPGSTVDETGPAVAEFLDSMKAQDIISIDTHSGVKLDDGEDE